MPTPRLCLLIGLWLLFAGSPQVGSAGESEALAVTMLADVDETGVVTLQAIFRSPTGSRVSFWVADPYDGGRSLAIRLIHEDGAAYVPWTLLVPRLPLAGAEGSIEPLVGERERGFSRRTRLFVREVKPEDPRTVVPGRLPPGRYSVQGEYTHPCACVPSRDAEGLQRWTAQPDLFAGTVRATPATLQIPRPATLVIDAELPSAPEQGRWPLTVTVRNQGTAGVSVPRRVLVIADGAPDGAVDATSDLSDPVPSARPEQGELPPGGVAVFTLDLLKLTFDTHRHKILRGPLDKLVGPALIRLVVQVAGVGAAGYSESRGLWRLVPDPAEAVGADR